MSSSIQLNVVFSNGEIKLIRPFSRWKGEWYLEQK